MSEERLLLILFRRTKRWMNHEMLLVCFKKATKSGESDHSHFFIRDECKWNITTTKLTVSTHVWRNCYLNWTSFRLHLLFSWTACSQMENVYHHILLFFPLIERYMSWICSSFLIQEFPLFFLLQWWTCFHLISLPFSLQ